MKPPINSKKDCCNTQVLVKAEFIQIEIQWQDLSRAVDKQFTLLFFTLCWDLLQPISDDPSYNVYFAFAWH